MFNLLLVLISAFKFYIYYIVLVLKKIDVNRLLDIVETLSLNPYYNCMSFFILCYKGSIIPCSLYLLIGTSVRSLMISTYDTYLLFISNILNITQNISLYHKFIKYILDFYLYSDKMLILLIVYINFLFIYYKGSYSNKLFYKSSVNCSSDTNVFLKYVLFKLTFAWMHILISILLFSFILIELPVLTHSSSYVVVYWLVILVLAIYYFIYCGLFFFNKALLRVDIRFHSLNWFLMKRIDKVRYEYLCPIWPNTREKKVMVGFVFWEGFSNVRKRMRLVAYLCWLLYLGISYFFLTVFYDKYLCIKGYMPKKVRFTRFMKVSVWFCLVDIYTLFILKYYIDSGFGNFTLFKLLLVLYVGITFMYKVYLIQKKLFYVICNSNIWSLGFENIVQILLKYCFIYDYVRYYLMQTVLNPKVKFWKYILYILIILVHFAFLYLVWDVTVIKIYY